METKLEQEKQVNIGVGSKLLDSVGGAFLIILMLAAMIILIFPARAAGVPAIAVYAVAMILLAGFSLKRSLNEGLSEVSRAWYGILGGMAAWTSLELSEILGFAGIECEEGLILIILASVFTWMLWKVFPLGARFLIFAFFLNWGGHVVIKAQDFLGETWHIFHTTLTIYSWAMIPLAAALIYWVLAKSETKIQRLYAAGWLYLFIFTFLHMMFLS